MNGKQLYDALRLKDDDEVNELINRHGGVNKVVVDAHGWTALHHAVGIRSGREIPILQKIWKMMKPDIDQKTNKGNTPLHLASYRGELPSVQWLVGHGSDPQAINDEKKTAKDRAKDKEQTEVIEFLDKVDSMKELFPLKEVSPLNYFAIGNYAEELEEYLTNVETDDPEVINYVCFIL